MRITIADVPWKDSEPHLTLGEVVSHVTVGHYRLTADSTGDWAISLFQPTGGTAVIANGSAPKGKRDPLAGAKAACEAALSLHLAGSARK